MLGQRRRDAPVHDHHFYFSAHVVGVVNPQQPSGQAAVTGVVPSSTRRGPSFTSRTFPPLDFLHRKFANSRSHAFCVVVICFSDQVRCGVRALTKSTTAAMVVVARLNCWTIGGRDVFCSGDGMKKMEVEIFLSRSLILKHELHQFFL